MWYAIKKSILLNLIKQARDKVITQYIKLLMGTIHR